jgi:hypothetical protein
MTKKLCLKLKLVLQPLLSAVVALGISSSTVHALTKLERRILQEAAPHTTAPKSGAKVIAHYATLTGYFEGQPSNAERLVKLKGPDLDLCVKRASVMGLPINLPTEWPDFFIGTRTDSYVTEHYNIIYNQGWAYAGYNTDCSLIEHSGRTAILASSAGLCTIDLDAKTAKGQCDMAAHRTAKPHPPVPPSPGPLQLIADLRCGIHNTTISETCIAVDGKMKPTLPLVLSYWSEFGLQSKARAAALDIEVSESVFTPHLQSGYRVTAKRP